MAISENLNYIEDQLLIQNDTIFAGGGSDSVTLYGGDDYINLGDGNDTATIYGGNSVIRMSQGSDFVHVQIDGINDHLEVHGGTGDDTLRVRVRSDVDVFDFIESFGFEHVLIQTHWEW